MRMCECPKEECCVNASVDGIVAVNARANIKRVQNVRRAVEATDMILRKQDRCHGRTNRNELLREVRHAKRGEEMTVMSAKLFEL